jgi:DNA-binding MarR family transcriptional regulator
MKDLVEINGRDSILNTFILFTQTARVAAKYQDSYMNKNAGISDVKLMVLMAFYYDPTESVTASQIAQWTDTAPNNVTSLINRMKREGLLEAKRDEKDKRFVKIKITDKGRMVLKESIPAAQQVVNQLMSSITRDEANSLAKILRVIRQNAYDGLETLTDSK